MNDVIEEAGLVITDTMFRKKSGKLWTYISDMTGNKTQIDYIMINKKWRNSVRNCEAYSTFSSIGSDHRVVTARLKLSLRTCKTPARDLYNWSVLCDQDIANQYSITVRNRYESLCVEGESATDAI